MKTRLPDKVQGTHAVGRRDLFKGAAAGAAALVGTRAGGSALVKGVVGGAAALAASRAGSVLAKGVRSYTLTASPVSWDVGNGWMADAYAYSVDGGLPTVPGPILHAKVGERVHVTVNNELGVPTTVHFHGVHPTLNNMDGVPGVTQDPILDGETFDYVFTAPRAGTFVYHTHYDTPNQMPRGLYGLLVVHGHHPYKWDREYPLVLGAFAKSMFPGEGPPPEQDDVMLINGKTFNYAAPLDVAGDAGAAERLVFPMNVGERVLFRIFNAGNEVHPMHTHGMCYDVVAADAWDLKHSLSRDTLGVSPGERYDIIALPDTPGVWLFHCHNLEHVAEGMIAVNVVS